MALLRFPGKVRFSQMKELMRINCSPQHTSPSALKCTVAKDRKSIEGALEKIINRFSGRIGPMALHLIHAGGKRLRPLLSCTILRAMGEDPMPHMELVACSEIIHTASLLHDDVVDNAETRRGRVALHVQFDSRTAVMAGDVLMATALEVLSDAHTPALLHLAARTICDMAQGQIMEAHYARSTTAPLRRLLTINRLKTAALFAYAAESAAILADTSKAIRRGAALSGERMGEAFQLVDDLLDWTGLEDNTGKAPGTDLKEGKLTMPLLLALRADPSLEEQVHAYWAQRHYGKREVLKQWIVRRVVLSGALDDTRRRAQGLAASAAAALDCFPPSSWRDELRRLAFCSVQRIA
ncbi:polyprenyl synthetase family protein [Acidobacteriota bacterium]